MPESGALVDLLENDLRAALSRHRGPGPLVVGLCGAQGSGKSTIAAALAGRINGTAVLSLDDLYLTKAHREALARHVHPLLATRGVPGTHDVRLGIEILDTLSRGEAAPLPRFDKAVDDRAPHAAWDSAPAGTRLLVLEGWCVGARAQTAAALAEPVNAMERNEDADGTWRRFVNQAIATDYAALFSRIDRLILLAAPGFEVVLNWRTEQEERLRQYGAEGPGVMSNEQVTRFVAHYERLTRHILTEMPDRADITIRLASTRSPINIERAE